MENEGTNSVYRKEDDFDDLEIRKKKEEAFENPLLRTDFQTFLSEEILNPISATGALIAKRPLTSSVNALK